MKLKTVQLFQLDVERVTYEDGEMIKSCSPILAVSEPVPNKDVKVVITMFNPFVR